MISDAHTRGANSRLPHGRAGWLRLRAARLRDTLLPDVDGAGPRTRALVSIGIASLVGAVLVDGLHRALGIAPSWDLALEGPVPAAGCAVATIVIGARAVGARAVGARAVGARAVGARAVGARAVEAVADRRRRAAWGLVTLAFASYTTAFVIWGDIQLFESHPDTWIDSGFWFGFYPLLCSALFLALRWYAPAGIVRRLSRKMLLDGLLAATSLLALGAAFAIEPVLHAAHHAQYSTTETVLDFLFPALDLVVGVLILALIGLRGWRLDRRLALVGTAFAFWLTADCLAALEEIGGARTGGSGDTLCYLLAFLCGAAAAWQRDPNPAGARVELHWSTLIVPSASMLAAPIVLIYDHFNRISTWTLVITWLSMLLALIRISLALRDAFALKEVQRVAMTDELTQLPNRRMFMAELRQRTQATDRTRDSLTVLMLDLDNFKQLNDTLGHAAGDELLSLVGSRLLAVLGPKATVARLGGDEFGVMLEHDSQERAVQLAAESLLKALEEPFGVRGLALRLTGSVGVAAIPRDAAGPDELLRCADVAMYEAKRSRTGWARYSSERDANTRQRLELSGELARALESGEIEVVFQPMAQMASGRIVAAEALVRWRLPDGRLQPPSEFLEAAELAGLSRPLTRRVLGLALTSLRDWRAAGHDVELGVNVTVADLVDLRFPDELVGLLEARELPPRALTIEVTESSIMSDPARVNAVLTRLRNLGVGVALDDFGTGYSSLTHLRTLPIDWVKIDRSFVSGMCREHADAAIVRATIELSHQLELGVVAEGVEDARTWEAIRELGADLVQGYALSRPVDAEVLRAQLESSAPVAPMPDSRSVARMPDSRSVARMPDSRSVPHLADSQSVPTPASTASGGSIS